jgi:hypothetical protein
MNWAHSGQLIIILDTSKMFIIVKKMQCWKEQCQGQKFAECHTINVVDLFHMNKNTAVVATEGTFT